MIDDFLFFKASWIMRIITLFLLFLFGCSHFSTDEQLIIATASSIRLEIYLNEIPQSAKAKWLDKIQKSGISLEKLRKLLSEDWQIKYERYGKADASDHKAAGCMHVYGKCVLKEEQEMAWETLQFYFPSK
jgi:hypothetical protein